VIVDPPPPPDPSYWPQLTWHNSVTLLADVSRVALHDASHRLYLLVGDDVYQVDTTTPIVGPNFHLAAQGLEIAVSNDGDHLFVVTEPPGNPATDPRQLVVVRTSDMTEVRTANIMVGACVAPHNGYNSNSGLVVAGEGRGRFLATRREPVVLGGTALTGAPPPAPPVTISLVPNLQSLAVASDATRAYAVGSSSSLIKVLNLETNTVLPDVTVLPALAQPSTIAVVRSSGPDLLAIADQTGQKLYLVGLNPLALFPEVPLAHAPIALAASPGGHWLYVLERDGDQSYVQVVDAQQLQQNIAVSAGAPLQVGNASQQLVISASGGVLYIPYLGDPANTFDGGVAKV